MFVWDDYLALADELSRRSSEENCMRTAISRAYYAAYCSAIAWYEPRYGQVPRPVVNRRRLGLHEALWVAFQDPIHQADKRFYKVGARGDTLRRHRTMADYRLHYTGNMGAQTPTILGTARNLITDLGQM